jgi:transposase
MESVLLDAAGHRRSPATMPGYHRGRPPRNKGEEYPADPPWRLGRVITVVDRGFSSDENLKYLTRAGGHWIAGERMRDGSPDVAEALSRQGRYQTVRDNLRVKEVRVGEGEKAKRFIICHNPAEAEREQATRDDTIKRLEAELERIDKQRSKAKTAKAAETHTRAECALRDHPALGRYLRQTPTGRLKIDRSKIAAEAKLDGNYLLSTSDPDLSAEDVALGYKNLLEAERGFRDLKTTIELRPIFHRLEHRIRAHVLLSWLALLLIRVAERHTDHTWRRIELELSRLHLLTLTGPTGTFAQTTQLAATQAELYNACSIQPPPRITTLQPA